MMCECTSSSILVYHNNHRMIAQCDQCQSSRLHIACQQVYLAVNKRRGEGLTASTSKQLRRGFAVVLILVLGQMGQTRDR